LDEILSCAGIFQEVEPGADAALTSQLSPVDFPRAHAVFAQGDPGDCLYVIISGKIKISNRSPAGQASLLAVLGPSDMFGELSVFDPGPRTSSAITITQVHAVKIGRDVAMSSTCGRRRPPTPSAAQLPPTRHQFPPRVRSVPALEPVLGHKPITHRVLECGSEASTLL
jgi:hypothetical protein